MITKRLENSYLTAKERYAEIGIDTDRAIEQLSRVALSLHCWQGDDVGGFETPDSELSGGGIQVTGNYPGKARSADELRADLDMAYAMIPGKHRLNLHAIYGEFGGKKVDRNEIAPEHYQGWIDWARTQGIALDFNATLFSHQLANDGFTLSSADGSVREFWIEHCKRARAVGAYMGKELGQTCIHNLWIPDGSKDFPADRYAPRERLRASLDAIYSEKVGDTLADAVECKLFGIGSESFVVGSHEFYMGYALKNDLMVCLDMGHFHPTESVADKISSILLFAEEVLLHVSRGVRWDSDHVVIGSDELYSLAREVVRAGLDRVHIALDYFDATLNRVGAWVTGSRAAQRAILLALLEPTDTLRGYEDSGRLFERLAMFEELKSMPSGDVWNYFLYKAGVPVGTDWMKVVSDYGEKVIAARS